MINKLSKGQYRGSDPKWEAPYTAKGLLGLKQNAGEQKVKIRVAESNDSYLWLNSSK